MSQLLIIPLLIGFLTGLCAILLHYTLTTVEHWVINTFLIDGVMPKTIFFIIPAIGGLLSGLLVYSLAPETEGHGTDAMIDTFHNHNGKSRKRVPLIKSLASILTIGSGGSGGYEGPASQIGSGLGSIISRLFRVPENIARKFFLAGSAAGLGSIFHAPLGGALTSVEVIYKEDFETEALLPAIVAAVVAYATFTQFTGNSDPIIPISSIASFQPLEIILFGTLGLVCVPVSWLFVKVFYTFSKFFKELNIPRPFKPAIGGLCVGGIAFICPQAVGEGWRFLEQGINGNFAIHTLIWIVLFKIITTSLTVGSGGSGGVFGPALFIGGMLGGIYGYSIDLFFPELISSPSQYILVGMGAFFAGAANAPIASIIMVCELSGNYALLAPLMFSSIVHVMLSSRWSIYKNQKQNKFDSPVHHHEINVDILKSIRIDSIFELSQKATCVENNENFKKIQYLLEESNQKVFPVLEKKEVIGLLSIDQIRKVMLQEQAHKLLIVEDMMTPLYYLSEEMDLHSASQIFLKSTHMELPVLSNDNKVIGLISYSNVITAYNDYLNHL